jgi:CBS domain-containing protein
MNDLCVRDVMNPSVVVVTADCTCEHVVDVITEFGVSGVPVVRDDDRVIGIISEADLLPRLHPSGAVSCPGGSGKRTARKVDARTAGELMTAPPVTVTAGSRVSDAAELMEQHRVKRLPVLDDETGVLVGIVTRRDLLRGVLRSDEAIERELMDELVGEGLSAGQEGITASVRRGVVTLSGTAAHCHDAVRATRIARGLDGVVALVDDMTSPAVAGVIAARPAAPTQILGAGAG